jgi:hypothetical protein
MNVWLSAIPRECCRLQREVGFLVERVVSRSSERALKAGEIAKLLDSLLSRAAEDGGVELLRVGEVGIGRLVLARLRIHRCPIAPWARRRDRARRGYSAPRHAH